MTSRDEPPAGDAAGSSDSDGSGGDTVPWRAFLTEVSGRLTDAAAAVDIGDPEAEARWLIEAASGLEGADWVLGIDEPATQRGVARLDAMVDRRLGGEPIQYVLGRWAFRSLDLLCDRRVLIPRPETEQVVEVAITELDRLLLSRHAGHRPIVVDLGTGSGAIALSIAVERPGTEVWGVDASADALAVARANLAGTGIAGRDVRLAEGSWFEPLPTALEGAVDVVVTNPPYIASDEDLPASVAEWEPAAALVSGPTGLEAYEQLISQAPRWLAPDGILVMEIGSTQAAAVEALARHAGFDATSVHPDLAGLDRTVVARRG